MHAQLYIAIGFMYMTITALYAGSIISGSKPANKAKRYGVPLLYLAIGIIYLYGGFSAHK